ncbi:flagellar biosynthesis regulator FlaF [Oceanicella actignis]|uniref:Flagellar protein FlaF n=1 Tax=Oceanicella actignis TaxID=1189325 RepID=A0A1M7SVP6_9RHOB|nr:flagellar biosynthesis regulator FlaF [Oceanicella actignis]TYO90611.1 flagellar protein FlaF [Oceanicella actignis]SES72987.1 flagellar protein FlaF [Oceanicella actignis]SHN62521.1 flagellar protein FlaF [Oceanicella actignis]
MQNAAYAHTAYGNAQTGLRTPRQDEYRVFAQVTSRISDAAERGKEAFPDLARALYDNNRLWAALAADVLLDSNPLPVDLRARIFNLAEFTRQHTLRVLAGDADPAVLVDINTAVMRGLRGCTGDA